MPGNNYYYPRTPVVGATVTPSYPVNPYQQIFVQGIEGARAYQLPYGVNAAVLWDTEKDLFYLKQIDAMGRPFIAKVCSYADYVEPETKVETVSVADTTSFVTKEYLDKILSQLSVGEKGRIVRDEPSE